MGLVARRIGVADLKRAAAFYENAFGFARDGEVSERSGADAGAAGAHALVQRLVDPRGAVLELIQVDAPRSDRTPKVLTIGHYGLTHLAFLVESLAETRAKVADHGGTPLDHTRSPVLVALTGMYLADPDGTRIEIMEGTGMAPLLSHSGITVKSLEESMAFYEKLGFAPAESYDMRDPQEWMAQLNEMEGCALFAQMMRDSRGHTLQLLDIVAPKVPDQPRETAFDSLGLFELVIDSDAAEGTSIVDPNGVRIAIAR